jgi:hypothetical protein
MLHGAQSMAIADVAIDCKRMHGDCINLGVWGAMEQLWKAQNAESF